MKSSNQESSLELKIIYDQLPATDCARCLDCCRVSPPVSISEMWILDEIVLSNPTHEKIAFFEQVIRAELLGRIISTGTCPFLLNAECSIYEYRPLACRQFGLTSNNYYTQVLRNNRKRGLHRSSNIMLFPTLQDKEPPNYCTDIWLYGGNEVPIADNLIRKLYKDVLDLDPKHNKIGRKVMHISYSLGLLIRCWGLCETQERFKIMSRAFSIEGKLVAERLCNIWAKEVVQLV